MGEQLDQGGIGAVLGEAKEVVIVGWPHLFRQKKSCR
jgi:hypothetical protein